MFALPGAANDDAPVSLSADNGVADSGAIGRVVDGLGAIRTEVDDVVVSSLEIPNQVRLKVEASVVATECNAHIRILHDVAHFLISGKHKNFATNPLTRPIGPTFVWGVHLSQKRADSPIMVLWSRISRARRTSEKNEKKSLRERGAALVEFALVAPLFFFVVFGGIEFGLMFRSYLSLQDVSRNAARVAAVERNDPDADLRILQTVQNRLDLLNGELVRVVVFNAPTLATEFEDLPTACTSANPTDLDGNCTVYEAADVASALASDTPDTNGFTADQRVESTNVGIYIEYKYQYVTGFFDTRTLSATTVQVVELDL